MSKTVEVRISNRVVVSATSFRPDELFAELRDLCTHKNPAHATWQAFRARTKQGRFQEPPKTIQTYREIGPGVLSLPVGRLDGVIGALERRGFAMRVVADERNSPPERREVPRWVDTREPWGHQVRLVDETVDKWRVAGGGVMIWRSPAGSGKTTSALRLIWKMAVPTLVVVPTMPIMDQWLRACVQCLGVRPSLLGGGSFDLDGMILVAQQKSAAAHAEELGAKFTMMVADEIQNHASDTCQRVADLGRYRYRLGVSQDERRADGRQFLIYDQFGTEVLSVDESETIGSGATVPVDVVVVPTDFRADWYTTLSSNDRFRARATLVEAMTVSAPRNAGIRAVSDANREAGHKTLVITSRVEHAKELHGDGVLLLGRKEGFSARDFERNVERFATDPTCWVAAGTEKSVGVGFESHPGLGRVVLAAPFVAGPQSEMQFRQFIKRASRSAPGKARGVAHYFLDVRVFGTKPLKLIKKWVPNTTVMVGNRLVEVSTWLDRFDRGAA